MLCHCTVLGREHVRCFALPNSQLLGPQQLARRPRGVPQHLLRRALQRGLSGTCFPQTRRTAAEHAGIISCEVRAYFAVAARAGDVQPTELLYFFHAYRYVHTGADSHAAMRVCVAGGGALVL